jgi:DNA-binding transcriptional LysR family regulator
MDVHRLELLRELAERGSITAVAQATHRTASAVSQQLKVLEAEAGQTLTEPSGRGIVLTDAGRALARSAADVAIALARAQALWDQYVDSAAGEVSLALFPTAGQMLLSATLDAVAEVDGLTLTAAGIDPAVDGFADAAFDFDIVIAHSQRGAASWANRDLVVEPLLTEPLEIALPLGHRLAGRHWVSARDLADETWIGVPEGAPFDWIINDVAALTGHPARVDQRFADTRIVESLVAGGHGIAVLPRYTSLRPDSGIVLKPLQGVATTRHIMALMRPDRAERLSVQTVVRALREAGHAVEERFIRAG